MSETIEHAALAVASRPQEMAVHEQTAATLSTDQLKFIANTEFVPKGLRGNLPAILACVATGREVGIGDMAALRNIHLIDGRPTFSAEVMVLLVRRRGHSITGSVSGGAAVAKGRRADTGDEMVSEWTLDMADRAGLAGKQNWRKYPEAMLWARAVSQLCRMLFADVFAGGTYTPEELGDDMVYSPPEVSAGEPMGQIQPGAEPSTPPASTAGSRTPGVGTSERASSADIDQPAASASHTPPVADAAAGTEVTAGEPRSGFQAPPGVRANCQHPPDSISPADMEEGSRYRCGLCGTELLSKPQMAKIHAVIRELDGHAEADPSPIPEPWKDGAESWVQVLKAQLTAAGVESRKQLTSAQAGDLIEWLEAQRVPF